MITLVSAAASAGLGFALVALFARLLGAAGSGVVLQAIAIFSIAMSVTRLGSDTTAMWLLPRLRQEDATKLPAGFAAVLGPPILASLLVAIAWAAVVVGRDQPILGADVDRAVTLMAPLLPASAVMFTALAATRAFGGVRAFNLIQNLAVPAGRVVVTLLVVGLGGSAVLVAGAWALVFLPAALAAVVVLFGMARAVAPAGARRLEVPPLDLMRRVAAFGLPRTVSAVAEQVSLWLAVVLVGVLIDASAAGAYGAAARFVGAGMIVATAVRIAVAPRFSGLLGQGRVEEVRELYSVSARWVLLFGAPIYLLLAVNAPTVLGWLGDGFDQAESAMVILCLGSVALLAAGNVQSLLLMSGGSGQAAIIKLISITVLVVATLLLVPRFELAGAAIAWSLSTVLDQALAAIQVHRSTGIALDVGHIMLLIVLIGGVVAAPSLLAVSLLGHGLPALVVGTGVAGLGMLVLLVVGRRPLHVDELLGVFGRH
jgi:O-antigen/teichoic acid export membrane protein